MPIVCEEVAAGGLAFMLALSWNDVLRKAVDAVAPRGGGALLSLLFAALVTLFVYATVKAAEAHGLRSGKKGSVHFAPRPRWAEGEGE